MRRVAHIVVLAVLLAAICACGRRGRVIPEDKMIRIYHDMFLADQWVRDNSGDRAAVDTCLLFDPIFRRYGYSFEDYDRTVHYYLEHDEKYIKLLKRVEDRLRKEGARLQKEADVLTAREVELERFRKSYVRQDFSSDSLRWAFRQRLWPIDTTKTQSYGLFEEIQLQPSRGGSSESGPDRRREPERKVLPGDSEKVLLLDGPDHLKDE